MSVGGPGRYSEHSWGPILKNGNVPKTESQSLGWFNKPGAQPLVKKGLASKRQAQRSVKTSCGEWALSASASLLAGGLLTCCCVLAILVTEEVAYADNFFASFGVGLYAPRGTNKKAE